MRLKHRGKITAIKFETEQIHFFNYVVAAVAVWLLRFTLLVLKTFSGQNRLAIKETKKNAKGKSKPDPVNPCCKAPPSLRTADAFPVVVSLPSAVRRLSTAMISNNILLPLLLKKKPEKIEFLETLDKRKHKRKFKRIQEFGCGYSRRGHFDLCDKDMSTRLQDLSTRKGIS